MRFQVRALGIHFVAAHHVTPVNFAPSQTVAIVGCGAGGSGPTAHTVLRSNPIAGIHYRRFVEDPETLGESQHFMKVIDARTVKALQIHKLPSAVLTLFTYTFIRLHIVTERACGPFKAKYLSNLSN